MASLPSSESCRFSAETRNLLELVAHAVYPNPDVFLRELISNASDALDRLRLEAARDGQLEADLADPHILLALDPDQSLLTVSDNGIGMSREEVIGLIGTIAQSGSRAAEGTGAIGKFGIGFYASFMVADRVELVTRRAGQPEGTRWEWSGGETYTLESVPASPGTRVILHLKSCAYASELKLRELVRRYSDYLAYPIRMRSELTDELVCLNSGEALWRRPRTQVQDHEYHEFYQHLTHDFSVPLETIHFRAEGTLEFDALLFIPAHAPHDLFARAGQHGLELYVRRVLVSRECTELLPGYLRWVRGVVDAPDLALDLSRERLQVDRQVLHIRRQLVRRVLQALRVMEAERRADYEAFWRQCGPKFKEGLKKHPEERESLLELSLFASTAGDGLTSLAEYRSRMPADQPAIYYLNAESLAQAQRAPHLEALLSRGYEVLLLTDPVDALWVVDVKEHAGRPLQSAARSGLAGLAEPGSAELQAFEPLLAWLRTTLADQVKDVRLSHRLEASPACLVSEARDVSPLLEKMARATGQSVGPVKRVLELNPNHALVRQLRTHPQDATLVLLAEMLYASAVLAEGGTLNDPARAGGRLVELLEAFLQS